MEEIERGVRVDDEQARQPLFVENGAEQELSSLLPPRLSVQVTTYQGLGSLFGLLLRALVDVHEMLIPPFVFQDGSGVPPVGQRHLERSLCYPKKAMILGQVHTNGFPGMLVN